MNLKLIVAILAIAVVSVCAQAQQPSGAKVKADVQNVVKIISGDNVSRDPPRFVGVNLSSPHLFFEVLDAHSVDNRVIVANHRQRTGQRTFGHRWLRDELRR